MKKVTLLFTGMYPTADEIAFGRSIGAQFRNREFISEDDAPEPSNYVAGEIIPEPYEDVEVHPEWPADGIEGFADGVAAGNPGKAQRGGRQEPQADDKIVLPDDITLEWLKAAKKPELVKLAKEEEVPDTDGLNVDPLREALIAHFELGEE